MIRGIEGDARGSLPAFIVLIIMTMVSIGFIVFCRVVLLMLMMIIFIAVVMKAGLVVVMVWMIVTINASSKSGCQHQQHNNDLF